MASLQLLILGALHLYAFFLDGANAVTQAALAKPVEARNYGIVKAKPRDANISIYILPDYSQKNLRLRRPAHLEDDKYKKAMEIMRSLPKEHPHSLTRQAELHCAYCDSACEIPGFYDLTVLVHDSWLFFPFHRWFLYFFERILGKLLDDETFALPYWNWDSPGGMYIPDMFADKNSSLYDKFRNEDHYKLKVDLDYSKRAPSPQGEELEKSNAGVMYRQMVSGARTPELFFGKAHREVKNPGTIENQPHNNIHVWTGDPNQPAGEDLGRLYSAGRDPIFYSHHSNVDRMWTIWKTLPGRRRGMTREDPTDTEWLDSSFLFYDENERLVEVKVQDCVDTEKMGYKYQKQELPWLKFKPKHRKAKKSSGVISTAQVFPNDDHVFPTALKNLLKVTIRRPKTSRTQEEKEAKEEILVIEGIVHEGDEYIKFDVFLNDENEVSSGPRNAAFVGTYSNVPCKDKTMVKSDRDFGITQLLEVLGADDDKNVVVTLVPKLGQGKFKISGVRIKLSAADLPNFTDL